MSAEDDLRALLRTAAADADGEPAVDPGALAARARRRHRRRRLAGAGVALAAVVGAAVVIPNLSDDGSGEEEVAVGEEEDGSPEEGWTQLPAPPLSPRTGATAVWTGEEIVVFGGWDHLCPPAADCTTTDAAVFSDGAAYDPATGGWRAIAQSPVLTAFAPAATVAGAVYVASGCAEPLSCSGGQFHRYLVAEDAWEPVGNPPGGIDGRVLLPVGSRLLAFAASDEAGERPDHLFDPAADSWTELPDDPLPSVYDRQVVVDGEDLLLFGKPTEGQIGSDPVIGARYDGATGSWSRLPDAPGNGYHAWGLDGVVVLNPHFGLESTGGIFDPATDTWSALPPLPDSGTFRGDMAGAIGIDDAEYVYSSGWVFDVPGDRWVEVLPIDGRSTYQSSAVDAVGRRLFVFGGEDWSGDEGRLLGDAWLWTPPAPDGAPRRPAVWAQPPSTSNEGMAALIEGRVRRDTGADCLQIANLDGVTYPVVWPAGTVAADDGDGVVLPDGTRARIGDTISGGGGYLQASSLDFAIPAACTPETGEVAVFNPNEDVQVTPR
jgi:hypothetical protein